VPIEDVGVVEQLKSHINDYTGSILETISVRDAYKQYKLGRLGAVPLLSEELEKLALQLRKGL